MNKIIELIIMSIRKLSERLGDIYDRVNHLSGTKAARKLLTWLLKRETKTIKTDDTDVEAPAYPAYWGEGAFDDGTEIKWGRGVWN